MTIRIEDLHRIDFSDVVIPGAAKLPPIHPGEHLLEDFLKPLKMSQYALAKAIDVPPRRVNEIIKGQRAVTADTDLRLCKYFGLSTGWWLRLQIHYDTEKARDAMTDILARITRCDRIAA